MSQRGIIADECDKATANRHRQHHSVRTQREAQNRYTVWAAARGRSCLMRAIEEKIDISAPRPDPSRRDRS